MGHALRASAQPSSPADEGASLRQLIERARPDEVRAMEHALTEPAPGELRRLLWLRRLGEAATQGALAIDGVEAVLLSPRGDDVVFVGPARSAELEDQCSELLQRLQDDLSPQGDVVLQGGFFDRGLDAFDGYQRLDLHR